MSLSLFCHILCGGGGGGSLLSSSKHDSKYSFFQYNFSGCFYYDGVKYLIKGRVSRFSACASDHMSAVKLTVFGPIRSEYTTPAGN